MKRNPVSLVVGNKGNPAIPMIDIKRELVSPVIHKKREP
jgi:hypothetical protein